MASVIFGPWLPWNLHFSLPTSHMGFCSFGMSQTPETLNLLFLPSGSSSPGTYNTHSHTFPFWLLGACLYVPLSASPPQSSYTKGWALPSTFIYPVLVFGNYRALTTVHVCMCLPLLSFKFPEDWASVANLVHCVSPTPRNLLHAGPSTWISAEWKYITFMPFHLVILLTYWAATFALDSWQIPHFLEILGKYIYSLS